METSTVNPQVNENIDAYTGIYISSVLLILLSLFIIYFFYLFFKRKRKLSRLRKKEAKAAAAELSKEMKQSGTDNESQPQQNDADDENGFLLKTVNEAMANDGSSSSRKNSELIDYLISKHCYSVDELNSRKNSLLLASQNKKYQNQMLNSKVSLILLSSLMSQDELKLNPNDTANSELMPDKDLSVLLNNLLNMNSLDKETANKLSDTIAKYYANRRKVLGSLSSTKNCIHRSKSICALSTKDFSRNKLKASFKTQNNTRKNESFKHRRVYSEKCTRPCTTPQPTTGSKLLSVPGNNPNTISVVSENDGAGRAGRRQWASEKRNSSANDAARRNSFQHSASTDSTNKYKSDQKLFSRRNSNTNPSKASSTTSSTKSSKPTTIYELYKSNKLHVSSLFDGGEDD